MSYDKKGLMIVDRVVQPNLSEREIIYCGKVVDVRELPKILKFGGEAKKYWYGVSTVFRDDNEGVGDLTFAVEVFSYEELLDGNGERFNQTKIPFDDDVRQGLLGLLGKD
ncbi:hypothetical protein HOD75_03300 [archaeon]|jgi:hypothetical protein|nr:hypothetical protein [archaeon]MBT4241900.1 hypothetical protein [archaeon]MBT4418447.1 hypothetical protein [archaeon]